MQSIWRRIRKFVLFRILHADDTPHNLAMAVSVGLFIGWTPTVGLQMIGGLALAAPAEDQQNRDDGDGLGDKPGDADSDLLF